MRKKRGFTLIEILVALIVFSVVLVLVTTAFKEVLKAKEKLQANSQRFEALQIAIGRFEQDMHQLVQRYDKKFSLQGNTTHLSFLRGGIINPNGHFSRSTLQRVSYSFEGNAWVRRFTSQLVEKDKDGTPPFFRSQTLLHDLEQVELLYLDSKNQWVRKWPAQEVTGKQASMPHAVFLKLKIKGLGDVSRVFYISVGRAYALK